MPYGTFIHGVYRLIALIAFTVEKSEQKALAGVVNEGQVREEDKLVRLHQMY